MKQGDEIQDSLKAIVYQLAEEGMPVDLIQRDARVHDLLTVVKPPDVCEVFTHHRYLQSLIQSAKNPDGTRRFVSVQRPLFEWADEESDEAKEKRVSFYASLSIIEDTPALKVIALNGLRKLVNGSIRNAGFIAKETRDELIEHIGRVFDAIIGRAQAE